MRFEQLLFLTEVYHCPSLSVACENLHVTRQALSSALKKLEQELGAPLLNRSVKGVTLTAKGYEVLAFAEEVLALQNEFYHKFYATAGDPLCGALRLMALNPLRAVILPKLLAHFHQYHPQINLTMETHPLPEMLQDLLGGQTDLLFIHTFVGQFEELSVLPEGCAFYPLFECKPIIWCSKKSPLAKYKTIPFGAVFHYPQIIDSRLDKTILEPILTGRQDAQVAAVIDSSNIYVLEELLEENIGFLWDYVAQDTMLYRYFRNNPKLQSVYLSCPYHVYGGYVLKTAQPPSALLAVLLEYLNTTYPCPSLS